ncbi:MAG: hypothetical protein HPY89_11230 [Pelotomaculum sp.]|nr:hypothetical protein [Pelotomaculum sp.]
MVDRFKKALKNNRGNIVVTVIITVMLATIAVGVLTTWKPAIKNLNSASTARLIVTS